ncbi:hypothetical protein SAMN05216227_102531 [Pseudorhodobacter antarcticus]|jgi:hypothetical protein|uniref:Uncharacterized protein n=1 Tax=Pseudorhodobacter antarcticus TaxID=1077947 RepID=A0A1H8JGM0_9RHOB|nr:hypothetical protein [Pseudorhodobacter antarcticus]SEN79899.1 hypothetical protein SAMN05216227_102531 [Pseudorhodobacter antarcticus]
MDLIQGLAAASAAIGIAKDLREIDRGVDEASYKLKIAELISALADTKIALADAKEKITSLEAELDRTTKGDLCPKCRIGRLSLASSSRMSMGGLGNYGVEEWKFTCGNSECDFETKKVNDPQGLVPKFIAKR